MANLTEMAKLYFFRLSEAEQKELVENRKQNACKRAAYTSYYQCIFGIHSKKEENTAKIYNSSTIYPAFLKLFTISTKHTKKILIFFFFVSFVIQFCERSWIVLNLFSRWCRFKMLQSSCIFHSLFHIFIHHFWCSGIKILNMYTKNTQKDFVLFAVILAVCIFDALVRCVRMCAQELNGC